MNRFANHSTANKLSKTVPSPNPGCAKLAGEMLNTLYGKVEDFALRSNLSSKVGAGMGKVFDLDVSWRFQPPANFAKLGLAKGTVFDSAHAAEAIAAAASESRLEERCGNHNLRTIALRANCLRQCALFRQARD